MFDADDAAVKTRQRFEDHPPCVAERDMDRDLSKRLVVTRQ